MDDLKRAAARAAANLVDDDMVVGLGSGSTLAFVLRELARRIHDDGLRIVGVPTSVQTQMLAAEAGIPLRAAEDVAHIDLALDGADELDPAGDCIKGGGGAQTRERIVAAMAREFILVVDPSKCVERLGLRAPVPVEVVLPALKLAATRLEALGARVAVREGAAKLGPAMTDNGNPILDAHFDGIDDPARLDAAINAIPGVVGHGLFVGMAHRALIARQTGDVLTIDAVDFNR